MKEFMDEEFLLESEVSKQLYFSCAASEPIIDFHNHLNPKEILEDRKYENLTDLWLGADHYKWRAMRFNGVSERLITGNADPYEKFVAWSDTVQNAIGNPLYHWTHLELQRYFDIHIPLSPQTAETIWNLANEKLRSDDYSVRNLLRKQNVKVLCTTDDPIDDLKYHQQLRKSEFEIQVLPSFRPEKVMEIERKSFPEYIEQLGRVCKKNLTNVMDLLEALEKRLEYFITIGCRVSDHSIEQHFYKEASMEVVNQIYQNALLGITPDEHQSAIYKGFLLREMGKLYAKHDVVMQLHIGALRNNSDRMFKILGKDSGFDSTNDFQICQELSSLLNSMDIENMLPKTILYCLNPKDAETLATMSGNFTGNESGIRGKVQVGTSWWFCDHKTGIEQQIETIAHSGLLSAFVGMLTDSRSFLSFPRHEYFRRILCNIVGKWVENGEYPYDMEYLKDMICNICGKNAETFFSL